MAEDGQTATTTIIPDGLSMGFDRFPPELFDAIVTPAMLDHSVSKKASVPQLIAFLTAHDTLDYGFLADFFLSFRNFATCREVLELLIARLTWAIRKWSYHDGDEKGRDVAVRTFVVLRHWILNFFADDFVTDLELRQQAAGAINTLCGWDVCQKDDTISRVLVQLKRCWSKECSMYWDMPKLGDSDDIKPGGVYSRLDMEFSKEIRRHTVLQHYNGPIDPVLNIGPEEDKKGAGSLIRGGISLSSNVEVKNRLSGAKPILPAAQEKKVKSKKSIKNLVKRWGKSEKTANLAGLKTALGKEEVKQQEPGVRIDILSARVIEELDRILKRQSQIKHGFEQYDHRDSESTASSRQSMATLTTATHRSSMATLSDVSIKEQTESFGSQDCTTLSDDAPQQINVLKRSKKQIRNSLLDTHGVTDLMTKDADLSKQPPIQTDGAQLADFSSQLNIDQVSNCSGSLSSRRESQVSCVSYDSQLSGHSVQMGDVADEGQIKRRGNLGDLRRAAGIAGGSASSSSVSTLDTDVTTGTVEHDEKQKAPLLPCDGLDEEMAAELAAIPDETTEGDAVKAALRKLEGDFGEGKPPMSRGNTSLLYDEAFDGAGTTQKDVADLNVPSNETLQAGSAIKSMGQIVSTSPPPERPSHNRSVSRVPEPEEPLSVKATITHGNHMPFILDYSAELVSEQLTLIERDALLQVDWKELIELGWSGHLEPIQSWLAFLVERNVRGVEIAISRFNLMVNWVKSEILLTWLVSDRVYVISQLVEIAFECRQLQNYATVMQIVLALSCPMIQKLSQTWARVDAETMRKYGKLEQLLAPAQNFKFLRTELNAVNGMAGCIPFVGIYLSDLTNIVPKRKETCNDNDTDTVDFARYQTAAGVVKGLIQCVQWSNNYHLDDQRDVDLLAKCLYVHSLTQEEMEKCFEYLDEA